MQLELTFRNTVILLFRRRAAFATFVAATLLTTLIYCVVWPWQYESQAAIVVKLDQQILADPQLQVLQSSEADVQGKTDLDLARYIVNSHVDMLESEDVARATLEKLSVDYVYPSLAHRPSWFFGTLMDAAVDKLSHEDLSVVVDRDTYTLLVALKNTSPEVAQKTLQTLIGVFMEKQADVMRDPQAGFMKAELEAAHAKLDAAQAAYLEARRKGGLSDPDVERNLLLTQRQDIEENLSDVRGKVASDTASRDQFLRALRQTAAGVALSNENDEVLRQLDTARTRLANAEQNYLEATQSYSSDNPSLADARASVELARRQFNDIANASTSRVKSGINPVYQNLDTQLKQSEADLAADQAAVDQWTDALKAVQARVDHIDQVEGGIANYKRQLDVAENNYESYLSRGEEARINDELNRSQITTLAVAQAPSRPYQPALPKIPLISVLSILVALLGATGLCIALELTDRTIGPAEQVESETGLPLLVALDYASHRKLS
jgi:uncharacterized protein involved in exopolysaccharide biosynthesis